MESHRRLEIVELLRKRAGQASHALDVIPHGQVLALDVRSGNQVLVRIASDSPLSDLANERDGAVPTEPIGIDEVIGVNLHDLAVVYLIAESLIHIGEVLIHAVRRQLNPVR